MQNLAVKIVRFVEETFPGWVECQFTDAAGRLHTIVDKYPIFTASTLDASSQYRRSGEILCRVIDGRDDDLGGEVVRIEMPGIESMEGLSEFVVLRRQLTPAKYSPPRTDNGGILNSDS